MKLQHENIKEVKRRITEIVSKYLAPNECKIFFFGSRVSGKSHKGSDIDVGIEWKNPIPVHIMAAMREEIDNLPYLYTIELVDFRRVSADFLEVAKKSIEPIN